MMSAALVLGTTVGCKDQLDVGNPNAPTATPKSEIQLLQLATGGVYINGFLNGDGWLGNSYFSLPLGYNELLADNVGASASNNQVTTIAQPNYIIGEISGRKDNTSPTVGIIRTYNTRASTGGGNNAIHYEWLNMYSMNNAMNLVLSLVDGIEFTGNADAKRNTIKAWAYFWKGFAYSTIGTKYYSGVIANEYGVISPDYVGHDAMVAEGNKYYDLAATTMDAGFDGDILTSLQPSQTVGVGRGGISTTDEWKHTINTLKARNIMFNKLAPYINGDLSGTISGSSMSGEMTAQDWQDVLDLANDGIQESDAIFTGRTIGANDFFSAGGGTVASLSANPAKTSTFKVTERAIQNFHPGDLRFIRNFSPNTGSAYSNDYVYGTRYTLIDHDNLPDDSVAQNDKDTVAFATGVLKGPEPTIYANKGIGAYELVIAGSWEENQLMAAEAELRLGHGADAAARINAVRIAAGAGIDTDTSDGDDSTIPVLTGLESDEVIMKELSMERRTTLLFRGLSWYDNRRWGWSYDIAKGGGTFGNTIVIGDEVNVDATINYNFMDYWDVPANESVLNPPSAGSSPIKNPNF